MKCFSGSALFVLGTTAARQTGAPTCPPTIKSATLDVSTSGEPFQNKSHCYDYITLYLKMSKNVYRNEHIFTCLFQVAAQYTTFNLFYMYFLQLNVKKKQVFPVISTSVHP